MINGKLLLIEIFIIELHRESLPLFKCFTIIYKINFLFQLTFYSYIFFHVKSFISWKKFHSQVQLLEEMTTFFSLWDRGSRLKLKTLFFWQDSRVCRIQKFEYISWHFLVQSTSSKFQNNHQTHLQTIFSDIHIFVI